MTPLQTFAASIRILSMDAVQKANSGHPGAPMGMADMAGVLWLNHLRANPADTPVSYTHQTLPTTATT